ncbi:hypothetical protein [Fusibacter ferrireducens]|uniref:Na+/glutamate symporter n=1 Tax=Fusibacter ferrireducens TaxID=2785058 RepID=A0ABR9ZP01_9FIRM|nr:hypothetical protein [Fusibacter ferrireducens]MBF4692197.1 hypothetical protein [Fusibacter ferrireducens]
MDSTLAFTIIFVVLGIGDYVAYKTKAIISMIVFSSVVFLVGFWLGLPKTIFVDSNLLPVAALMIGVMITHMGTIISIKELAKQWKTVVISLASIIGIAAILILIGSPLIGKVYAISAAPPISGGLVASLLVSETAKAQNLPEIALFATLLLSLQFLFGYPIASICLKAEAKKISSAFRVNKLDTNAEEKSHSKVEEPVEKRKLIPELPVELQTSAIILAKLALVTLLSFQIAALLNGVINKMVICLIAGVIFSEIGFLEKNAMVKANTFGFVVNLALLLAYNNLSTATPQAVYSLLVPLFGSLILGIIGIAIFSIVAGKFLGYSWGISFAIGSSALFGFPGTYILSNEVSTAEGQNEEERKAILDSILPKMLVAGFVSVTIASVILAGVMVKMI